MLPFFRTSRGEQICTVFREGMDESSDGSIEQSIQQGERRSCETRQCWTGRSSQLARVCNTLDSWRQYGKNSDWFV